MEKGILGEFMGTMVLILLGNGAVANVLLKKSKAEGGGWMVIATGWGLAVMAGVFTAVACGSEGQLNPAVTLAAAITTGDFGKLGWYTAAQMAGAFAGACLVWLHYLPHWRATPEADLKRACFCTAPAIRGPFANLLSEMIATFVLVFVPVRSFRNPWRPAVRWRGSDPIWWEAWSGRSAWVWAGPLGMPSIRRATWGHESRTRCCRSRRKKGRTGDMPRFQLPAHCWALRWPEC